MESPTLVDRVRGEFMEMPGLQLTMAQAARLWGSTSPLAAMWSMCWLKPRSCGGRQAARS